MLTGAILSIGQSSRAFHGAGSSWGRIYEPGMLGGSPMVCVEVLGTSALERIVEKLRRDGVELVTVLVRDEYSPPAQRLAQKAVKIKQVPPAIDLWSAAECVLREYVQQGVQYILMSTVGAYAEFDFAQIVRFHHERKQGLTSVVDEHGHLELWVVDAKRVVATRAVGLNRLMDFTADDAAASYPLRGYVNRLRTVGDLRHLVIDAFGSRCSIRPQGREVRPGIWFGDGARAHRHARIAAPAYLGCGARLRANTVVTAFSTVERGCDVRHNTVIEDASVLANTYVGRGLNVSHAVIDGNRLLPLGRNLVVEIQDSKLLHRTLPLDTPRTMAGGAASPSLAERLLATAWN